MSIWRVSGICLHTFVTWYWSVYCSFYWEMISLTDEFKICRDKLLEMHRWDWCAEPASQRLCINLTCSFWAGACQVTPYVVVLLWCYSSSLVKKWLSDVLLFLWQPRFHQSGSSGGCLGCFCMCPSINTTSCSSDLCCVEAGEIWRQQICRWRCTSGRRPCGVVNRIFEEQNWSHYTH